MTTIAFSRKMATGEKYHCNETELEAKCVKYHDLFEYIPDDRPVKAYFDADHKFYEDFEDYNVDTANEVLRIHKYYLSNYFRARNLEPTFATASSHYSERYVKGVKCWGYSFHIVITNITMLKSDLQKEIANINRIIVKDQKRQVYHESNMYSDYISINFDKSDIFDTTVYKAGDQKFRCVYSSKDDEQRPFNLMEGSSFNDMVVSGFVPPNAVQYKPPVIESTPSVIPPTIINNDGETEVRKLIGLLAQSRAEGDMPHTYQDWVNVMFALVNELGNDGLPLWLEFSARSPKFNREECVDKYQGVTRTEGNLLTIKSLHHWAKTDNPEGYQQLFPAAELYISLETLEKGENDIALHISKTLIETLKFCNNRWYLFDKLSCLWRVVLKPSAAVISTIQTYIDKSKISLLQKKLATEDEEKKKELTNFEKKYNEFYKQVGKGAFTNQIINILQTYLFDKDFEHKLDTTPYLVAYKNGLYDLKTGIFRNGILNTDYLTQTIPYDYEKATHADITAVKHELLKICNNNPQHLEYYLSSLGYAMTGDSSREQSFWNIRGQKACNGKSVVFDALMNIIPNYIVKMESDIFEVNYGSRHKEISTWKGVRIGYINEL